jgi:hypothetical protein
MRTPITTGTKRLAVYKRSTQGNMDEGWTRWVLEQNAVPYTQITEADITKGALSGYDALILPDQSAAQISQALGAAGVAAVETFVNGGGTLLAFNDASDFAIGALKLPVKDVLDGVLANDFYAPGSIIGVQVDRAHPLARFYNPPVPGVWFEGSPAFEITDPAAASAVLTYQSSGEPLLSGWLLGGPKLYNRAAMVDVKKGQGHVVLYGFRPQYRGQPNSTFNLIWSAIAK